MSKAKKILYSITSLPDNAFAVIYIGTIFLLTALLSAQGLDLTDEGYLSYGFQHFFADAPTAGAFSGIYDTMLIGGLFHLIFPSLGMLAFRLASALCLTAIATIVFFTLKDIVNRWLIFLGTFIAIITPHYLLVFHYNYLSALIGVAAAFFLYKGCIGKRYICFFAAGIIVGIGFFVRIPNICLSALILVLIPFYIYTQSLKQTLLSLLYAVLGVIVGVGANFGIICLLHHQDTFISTLNSLFNTLTDSNAKYGSSNLLETYLSHILQIVSSISILIAFPYADKFIKSNVTSKRLVFTLQAILLLLFILTIRETSPVIHLYAFCSICLLYNLFTLSSNEKVIYLSVLAFLSMSLLPLGSDNGLYNVNSIALFLALPFTLGSTHIHTYIYIHTYEVKDKSYLQIFSKYIFVLLAYITLTSLYSTSLNTYRDHGSRLKKIHRPTLTLQKTTFTNQAKAEQIDTLFAHLLPHINEDTYILAYPNIPAINYLSNTKSYLPSPWVGILSYDSYIESFDTARRTKPLPVVVIQKNQDIRWYIPNRNWQSISDCYDWHPPQNAKNDYLQRFIEQYNYNIVWENELFAIYVTQQENQYSENVISQLPQENVSI